MAVAYHHIDEYEDVMPTPTNDVEIFRNTKFSQQWDKKIHETITQTETDHSKIINDKALTKEEKKPIVLQYPAFNMQGKHNKSSTENHKENEKKNVKTEEKGKNSNSNNNNVTMSTNNNNKKEIEEWKHASQFLNKRINNTTLKINEKRRFLVGSAMADEYIRLCDLVKTNGGSNLYRLRGDNRPLPTEHLTYGEAQLDSFVKVLQRLDLHAGQRFLDLGSGAGTLVILASLFGCESVGVEIVQYLYETSMILLDRWEEGKTHNPLLPLHYNDSSNNSRCQFLLQDMFEIPWKDYDLIYACSTCYGAPMCKRIAIKASEEMERGLILSVSKPLYNLKVIDTIECLFSWGKDKIFVHVPVQISKKGEEETNTRIIAAKASHVMLKK